MYLFENDIDTLNNTQYFYKGMIKTYFSENSSIHDNYREHSDYPRIPFLNPLYKRVTKLEDGNINISYDLFNTDKHTNDIDFEHLNSCLYCPETYLNRYPRMRQGIWDEDDESHDSQMIGYNRKSEFIPNLMESLVLTVSISSKGNKTKIYLQQAATVLYKSFCHRKLKNDASEFEYYKNLSEALFTSKDDKNILRYIPYVKGPLEVHGSDGTGNFCNVYYPRSIVFEFDKK